VKSDVHRFGVGRATRNPNRVADSRKPGKPRILRVFMEHFQVLLAVAAGLKARELCKKEVERPGSLGQHGCFTASPPSSTVRLSCAQLLHGAGRRPPLAD